MKRLLSILLALCLLWTVALAETVDTANIISWSDYEDAVVEAGWGGGFYEMSDYDLMFYVPEVLQPVEDENSAALFMSDDGQYGFMISVDEDSEESLEAQAELMQAIGAEDLEYDVINGLPGITFTMDGVNYVTFLTESGENVTFLAMGDDEAFTAVFTVIVASIQTISE